MQSLILDFWDEGLACTVAKILLVLSQKESTK
jgi:hypothetical protein